MRKPYEPSPVDISQICRDIRRTWSVNEELRRRGAIDQAWPPPGAEPAVPLRVEDPAEE
jgi:hypothetical protein